MRVESGEDRISTQQKVGYEMNNVRRWQRRTGVATHAWITTHAWVATTHGLQPRMGCNHAWVATTHGLQHTHGSRRRAATRTSDVVGGRLLLLRRRQRYGRRYDTTRFIHIANMTLTDRTIDFCKDDTQRKTRIRIHAPIEVESRMQANK
jgi:hypothetical protein